jgi:hypothetical protein
MGRFRLLATRKKSLRDKQAMALEAGMPIIFQSSTKIVREPKKQHLPADFFPTAISLQDSRLVLAHLPPLGAIFPTKMPV